MIDVIHCGDCLDVMAAMPDGVFRTCITSPPYWGLRDYGLEPVVWDGDPECQHEWGRDVIKSKRTGGQPGETLNANFRPEYQDQPENKSQFCVHCGAWLGCLGLEPTPELYVSHLVRIFAEVKRVLRDDGTLWLNIGDSYNSTNGFCRSTSTWARRGRTGGSADKREIQHPTLKPKDMVLIPFRLALALQADGWWVRSDIIWHKPNCMPSSVKDRPTTDFEHVFLLAKSKKYYYDGDAIREPHTYEEKKPRASGMERNAKKYREKVKYGGGGTGFAGHSGCYKADGTPLNHPKGRNKRTVWTIPTKPYKDAHFATFPPKLIEPMILAGSAEGDIVFDPFAGSGTTLAEAKRHGRHYCGIEANPEYVTLIEKRIAETPKAQLKLDLGGGK